MSVNALSAGSAESNTTAPNDRDRRVAQWLLAVAGLIFLMVLVGGATRLTGSGLSIVEWRPVTGILPPLSQSEWAAEFAKYQQSPEFQTVNRWMTVADFKEIYWLEYIHRLLGRFIGLAFFAPFVVFWAKGWLRRELVASLAGIFILGGLQGGLGWIMVQSGLDDVPAVSHYRLAAHLGLAILLYMAIIWTALGLLRPRRGIAAPAVLGRSAGILLWLVFAQLLLGALVAGLDAGYIYNTWPKMGDGWLPVDIFALDPPIRNFLDNPGLVQFEHRLLAYIITGFALWILWRASRTPGAPRSVELVVATCILQVGLGIATVMTATPVALGVAHQAGGLALLTAALYLNHDLRTPKEIARPA